MRGYLSYFKLKFITGLQYRAAALAGMSTQFFFGMVYVLVYVAFYESGSSTKTPMELSSLVSYVWLGQAFFGLVYLWYKDKEILTMIKNGNIAYELCRPQDLYFTWCSKILGERLAMVTLRFLPVILVAILLPTPYRLEAASSISSFLFFLLAMILSTFLMTVLVVLYHVVCLFTLDEKGIVNILMVLADILSGLVIPVPFFPAYLRNISNLLPFRYITDFPFLVYTGNVGGGQILIGLGSQIFWILFLFFLGRFITNKALRKTVIQGG